MVSLLLRCALVPLVVGIAGCGGGGSRGTTSSTSSVGEGRQLMAALHSTKATEASGSAVVRIGDQPISKSTVDRLITAEVDRESPSQRLIPPGFTECVALQTKLSHEPSSGVASASPSAFKHKCAQKYQTLRENVLASLISNYWVIGGASELGVGISDQQVVSNLEEFKRKRYPTKARFAGFLKLTRLTLADVLLQTRAELAATAARGVIKATVGPVTPRRVLAYYEAHRNEYMVPEKRDLEIVRTTTQSAALRVKHEIASGRSFTSVVDHLKASQPLYSNHGHVTGLPPNGYAQKRLIDAIFTARPGVLSGPVKIPLGYYVFEINKIHPRYQKQLTAVAPSLRQSLPEKLNLQALEAFIKKWRATWRARTDCRPGYVMPKCRQFRGGTRLPPEDPATLN